MSKHPAGLRKAGESRPGSESRALAGGEEQRGERKYRPQETAVAGARKEGETEMLGFRQPLLLRQPDPSLLSHKHETTKL